MEEVNRLLKQFQQMRQMLKGFAGMEKVMKKKGRKGILRMPFR